MFTAESLQAAHDILVKGVIQVIFQFPNEFKSQLLKSTGWKDDCYSIERCHIANSFRVTLKHDDGREKDVYIPSTKVYGWVLELQELVN